MKQKMINVDNLRGFKNICKAAHVAAGKLYQQK